MTKDEALRLALEAFEEINKLSIGENAICLPAEIDTAMDAVEEVLAQPEQEPVAWRKLSDGEYGFCDDMTDFPTHEDFGWEPLYTTPPQRTWVGLTDEEFQYCVELKNPESIAEEVEAKLKEKNT